MSCWQSRSWENDGIFTETTLLSSSSLITLDAPALMMASNEECLEPSVSIFTFFSPACSVKRSKAIRLFSLADSTE